MRPVVAALLPAVAVILAACSSGAGATDAPSSAGPNPPSVEPSAPAQAIRVEVKLSDTLRIEPAEMTAPVGVPVTFVVTNTGATEHEFYLGDEEAQTEHGLEMQRMGGMVHDEAMGIGVNPGETKELTVTFPEAGSMLAGCHVAGHYAAGMKATVRVGS